jgi:NAD(P)-dependent dehydrogenase (short-subunit alcohol dehydrogenase family)
MTDPREETATGPTIWHTLRDKTIMVIGASSGIGLAAARSASRAGANVILLSRDTERLRAAETLVRREGATRRVDNVSSIATDADDDVRLASSLRSVAHVDHVLVTAGTAASSNVLGDQSVDNLLRPHDVRLRASLVAVRVLAPLMRNNGSFVFTGGLLTDRPARGAWISGLAASSMEQLARVLAIDLAPLRFNAISPGMTDTPLLDAMLGAAKHDVVKDIASRTPIGRIARAQEAADAALFLMSNGAITGEVLHVDGGQRLV